MNFNSLEFLILFTPLAVLSFHLAPPRLRLTVLCLASCVFYGASGWLPLTLLVVTLAWGYGLGLVVGRRQRRLALALAVALPMSLLFLFKYLGYSLSLFGLSLYADGWFGFMTQAMLPAGISFYTFEVVCYFIDVHDGKMEPERDPAYFSAFLVFFPHLIAGPIMRYGQLRDQFARISSVQRLYVNFPKGMKFLIVGLAYKIFLADVPRTLMDSHHLSGAFNALDGLFEVLTYSMAIYYDFWGYSLMAVGLGELLAIRLPHNFDEPYLSRSPKEFWRRWHITLSFWLRDYVYIRLGGHDHYIRNILIVFAAVGLWHGAGTNFILWGLYHGAFVVLYHVSAPAWDRLPRPLAIAVTFAIVSLGWPLFYRDLDSYLNFLGQILSVSTAAPLQYGADQWAYVGSVALFCFLVRERWWLFNRRPLWVVDGPIGHAGLFVFTIMFLYFGRTFIYFQF